jgi:CDP-6-deoxy-D-xylo-4-hexulose-3-dehydrase
MHPLLTLDMYFLRFLVGELANTDIIMNDTFWIGVYPGLSEEMLDFVINKLKSYFGVNT